MVKANSAFHTSRVVREQTIWCVVCRAWDDTVMAHIRDCRCRRHHHRYVLTLPPMWVISRPYTSEQRTTNTEVQLIFPSAVHFEPRFQFVCVYRLRAGVCVCALSCECLACLSLRSSGALLVQCVWIAVSLLEACVQLTTYSTSFVFVLFLNIIL